jgi:FkbM family methyltransferase
VTLEVGDRSGTFYVHDVATLQKLKGFDGEEHLLSLLVSLLRPGDTVYDIGAEQGLYTVFCSKAVRDEGHIIAFEPAGALYERLQGNVGLNRLTNVRAFRLALADYSGPGRLRRAEIGSATALSAVALEEDNAESERVTVVPGDLIVEEKNYPCRR